MYRLLVWTSKGGTGKTTTVANTGVELSRQGYRVLLVGFDPQGDLEVTFGIDDDSDAPRVDTELLAKEPKPQPIPIDVPKLKGRSARNTRGGSLAMLACSPGLLPMSVKLGQRGYGDLDRTLDALDDDFDIALIDTQGALTPISA